MNIISGVLFDLYGTLYDVHSVACLCDELYPSKGDGLSQLWRQKQLEYTWLQSLTGRYVAYEPVESLHQVMRLWRGVNRDTHQSRAAVSARAVERPRGKSLS